MGRSPDMTLRFFTQSRHDSKILHELDIQCDQLIEYTQRRILDTHVRVTSRDLSFIYVGRSPDMTLVVLPQSRHDSEILHELVTRPIQCDQLTEHTQ